MASCLFRVVVKQSRRNRICDIRTGGRLRAIGGPRPDVPLLRLVGRRRRGSARQGNRGHAVESEDAPNGPPCDEHRRKWR